ncbi:MAG: hypothetical protein HFH08_01980 [Bacilli bacterium]|nr:hypothetical protein [Bacilli bacterium]
MEKKVKKDNPIKNIINSWKKIDGEKRTLIIIIVFVLAFIFLMPNLYKGWVNLRDHGFNFGSKDKNVNKPNQETKDPNAGKTLTMTCSQTMQDNEYKTEIKTLIYYVDNQLKKENYTITMTALNDVAREELPVRKSLYDITESTYHSLDGFTVKSNLTGDVFTYNLITDYAAVNMDAVNKEDDNEENQITVDLKYNQKINSVQSYYEKLGLKCTK